METNVIESKNNYAYILEGENIFNTLLVDEDDLIENADGILDCPFDGVLRKYKLTLRDLNEMKTTKLLFVKLEGEKTIVLNTICLNLNM
ncbi:hypothetical protein [Carnobacterium pleistocenium]|uniref:hypothetical protein n=1 Tax=Carnobacterium pleistocenium TaxID=181073 RepID=UPI00054FA7D6|nr:hypothetical protein [Carnobacterium pleistocenium]